MDYNTSRRMLILPEYGRNIQQMVNHIKTVEDRDERNRLSKAVIQIMGSMNPQLRDVSDFKHKLWDHLAIISDFDLDIDLPFGMPKREDIFKKPERLPYRKPDDIKYKHYGRVIEEMIDKAVEYNEGEEKDTLVELIANQMKKSYVVWNRDNATDEQIFEDLEHLSRGRLRVADGVKLKDVRDLMSKPANNSPANNRKQQKTNKNQQQKKRIGKKY